MVGHHAAHVGSRKGAGVEMLQCALDGVCLAEVEGEGLQGQGQGGGEGDAEGGQSSHAARAFGALHAVHVRAAAVAAATTTSTVAVAVVILARRVFGGAGIEVECHVAQSGAGGNKHGGRDQARAYGAVRLVLDEGGRGGVLRVGMGACFGHLSNKMQSGTSKCASLGWWLDTDGKKPATNAGAPLLYQFLHSRTAARSAIQNIDDD